MTNDEYRIKSTAFQKYIAGGMIGLSTVIVTQLLTVERMDISQTLCAYCLSASIPSLSALLLCLQYDSMYVKKPPITFMRCTRTIAYISTYTGLSAMFYHFSWKIMFAFFFFSIFCCIAAGRYIGRIVKINETS